MAKLTAHQIQKEALGIVLTSPTGIRYSEIHRRIAGAHPETPPNSVHGAIQGLEERFRDQIEKPSRGVYRPVESGELPLQRPGTSPSLPTASSSSAEAAYYQPFADWLVHDHDEATIARPLGGSCLSRKWGTPDVVGVYKPVPSDMVQFPKEIIAAEIKTDAGSPIVAFGQATAYRLFSTKSYVVLPKSEQNADLDRVDALAMLCGIGLVVFEGPPSAPKFEVRVRAQRLLPDMFYLNEFAHRLSKHDRRMFDELFA